VVKLLIGDRKAFFYNWLKPFLKYSLEKLDVKWWLGKAFK
jgi:hypothetical protein